MYKIPVVVPFYEDELINSWVFRLADANGFSDVRRFVFHYFYPNETEYKGRSLRINFTDNLYHFWNALPANSILPSELLIKTTTFTGFAPFLGKDRRQKYLCKCFYNECKSAPLFMHIGSDSNTVKLCPACMKEEIAKYGGYFIHKSHQMPTVATCTKHRAVLHKTTYSSIRNLTEIPETTPVEHYDYGLFGDNYDFFCADFLKEEFDFNMDTVAYLMEEYLPLKGEGFEKRYKAYLDSIKHDDMYGNVNVNASMRYDTLSDIRQGADIPIEKTLTFLFNTFVDASYLKEVLPPREPNEDKRFSFLAAANGYTLLGEYRDDVVSLRHDDCGTVFATSPYGFNIGWRCPVCDRFRTPDEQLAILADNMTDGNYKPVSKFKSSTAPVKFHHNLCGRTISLLPRQFLYAGIRCNCGHEHTDNTFASRIKDLTGEEYSLVGSYTSPKTKVTILHNKCGLTHDYKPYYFLDGARCPFCTPKNATQTTFIEFVKNYTSGRYVITRKATRNFYEIKDTVSGKIQRLSRLRIMQELTRPTESPLLPFANKPEGVGRNDLVSEFPYKWLYSFVKKLYPYGGIIYWDEVITLISTDADSPFKNTEEIYANLQMLVDKNLLKKLTQQYYCFPDQTFTPKDVIVDRYIFHNGQHIGFYRGVQFAEEIGLLPSSVIVDDKGNDSRIWHICSNTESAKTPQRKTKFFGQDIHIKGCPVEINNDNWLILSALDFLLQYKQIVKLEDEVVFAAVKNYLKTNNDDVMFSFDDFKPYMNYKTGNITTMMNRIIGRLTDAENT